MSERVYGVAMSLLLWSLVFPMFAYALTDLSPETNIQGEIEFLSADNLIEEGIYLRSQERHSLAYNDLVTFELNETDKQMRVRWDKPLLASQSLWAFYQPAIWDIGDNPTWLGPTYLAVNVGGTTFNPSAFSSDYPNNLTMITNFNYNQNWTRISVKSLGAEVFITAEKADNNITQAILYDGLVNVTVGQAINYEEFKPLAFMSWYWSLLTDQNTYGLPIFLAWLLRFNAILTIFTGVIIVRELTRV